MWRDAVVTPLQDAQRERERGRKTQHVGVQGQQSADGLWEKLHAEQTKCHMFGVVWLVPVINTLTKHCLGLTNSQRLTLNLKKLVSLAKFKLKTTHNATCVVPLYLFVCWFDSRHEHPVAINELHEGVADWISCTADPNGLHHPRVPQLTHTKLPVKQLQAQTQQLSLKFLVQVLITSSKVRWYLRNSKWSLITCWNNLKKKGFAWCRL